MMLRIYKLKKNLRKVCLVKTAHPIETYQLCKFALKLHTGASRGMARSFPAGVGAA